MYICCIMIMIHIIVVISVADKQQHVDQEQNVVTVGGRGSDHDEDDESRRIKDTNPCRRRSFVRTEKCKNLLRRRIQRHRASRKT
ncbi:hypothetical protein F2P81_017835 [Scophthalmus maximus]|uniref:Secreted protein n=1 Tax=Scophthalmus maximus TaxID=52904 RepID=A0A6A4SAN2_SCOMX|nr:hypothetical protein F2P81_017835 [Scophthalmus maximus]